MLKIVEVKTASLKPYENNPRNNGKAVKAVADSIQKFGFKNPIIITKDNEIIAGHTRLEAAQMLELETVPVIYADDLTEQQIKAFRLADNKTGELAVWDFEKLEEEIDSLDDEWIDRLFGKNVQRSESALDSEGAQEIDLDDFSDDAFEYECGACGFRFNEGKNYDA